ncbi:MAG: type II secretion system protein [Rickettsiales bacterium]
MKNGFTLIELSVVLIIIGLIVSGVLLGNYLIEASKVSAQISQITKYNLAVRAFQSKYNCLPGDCKNAQNFGFKPRGIKRGQGDGNSFIDGYITFPPGRGPGNASGCCQLDVAELALFWTDLSMAQLIDGNFNTASATVATTGVSSANLIKYMPKAKLGNENYIYVIGGGYQSLALSNIFGDNNHYFGIQQMNSINQYGWPLSNINIKVITAYNIDKKIDDGFPQSGGVMTLMNEFSRMWAGNSTMGGPFTTATPSSNTSCFDNGNVNGEKQRYSLSVNDGNNSSCALLIKFQ